MQKNIFYKTGTKIYPMRWYIIAVWIILVLGCIPFLPNIIDPFETTGFSDEHAQSAVTQRYVTDKLGFSDANRFVIMYHSDSLTAEDDLYITKIKESLAGLEQFPIPHDIILPDLNEKQISPKDNHTAYAAVIIKSKEPLSTEVLDKFKSLIKTPSMMTMQIGGELVFVNDVNKQTEKDLYRVDFFATPAAIITLIFVFGSIVAALLPIVLGGGCALLILITLYFLGHLFPLSIFTLNIALLLGLCLSLDYALFIISRFCDELQSGHDVKEAVAITQGTAGKAIFFSGIAVFASLSALMLFPINILFSVAIGGLVAVFVAVSTAIIVLPAVLSVLGHKITLLSVRSHKKKKRGPSMWHWLAIRVVDRPKISFIAILVILLLLGYPFLTAKFGVADYRILPEQSQDRQFFDTYGMKFNEPELTPVVMVVKTTGESILSLQNISKLYDLADRVKANPSVSEINSIVTTDPRLTKKQYYDLFNAPKDEMNKDVQKFLALTTGTHFTVMDVISKYQINSTKTKALITYLDNMKTSDGMSIHLTGTPVNDKDVLIGISKMLPYAILWIMVFTYLILLVLLRSVFLPIKAIAVNLLSLSACYGALVLVFQDGYLHQLLNFETQGMLDISLLVIIFCALFGFSMDYEVFLLTRIKESYESNHNNRKSIVFGIEKSCRIITSAAIIVIVICGSFLIADVLMVKAFGLGIAVAISVDAFLIRTVLVPATMTLTNKWNWYLPKWLDKILPHL